MANLNKMNVFYFYLFFLISFQVLKAGCKNTVKLQKFPALDWKTLGQRLNEHKQINKHTSNWHSILQTQISSKAFKRTVHLKMNIHSLFPHAHADGKPGEDLKSANNISGG